MSNVTVLVRCRPVLANELHLKRTKIECNEINNTIRVQSAQSQATDRVFTFNSVLPETSTQEDVFEAVSPIIDAAISGLHATAFCYGTTGSGKTHTMEGLDYVAAQPGSLGNNASSSYSNFASQHFDRDERNSHTVVRPDLGTPKERHGIVLRAMEALFERIRGKEQQSAEEGGEKRFRVRVSFVQLYNEKLTDLITKRGDLKLRWSNHGTFAVDGLTRSQCETPEQVRELFFMAVRNKAMGSHAMNQQSSRSHCIYTFHIEQWCDESPENVIRSDLALVDLAGSEKLAMMAENPSAQLLRESIDINCSLLALGKVITALAIRAEKGANSVSLAHVPYRESKLTKLLQHALGGNAVAVMIACITPLDSYVEETVSTLMYAGRARNIRNDPRINEDPRAALIRQLREENQLLKAELAQYRQFVLEGNDADMVVAATALREKEGDAINRPGSNNGALRSGSDTVAITRNNNGSSINSHSQQTLAEKLLSSCTMLKDVVTVNARLRDAFDSMHGLKKQAERREAELQAENLALRERIEMLESIALRDDDETDSQPQQQQQQYQRGNSTGSANNNSTGATTAEDAEYYSDDNNNNQVRTPHGGSNRMMMRNNINNSNRLPSPVPASSSANSAPLGLGLPTGGFAQQQQQQQQGAPSRYSGIFGSGAADVDGPSSAGATPNRVNSRMAMMMQQQQQQERMTPTRPQARTVASGGNVRSCSSSTNAAAFNFAGAGSGVNFVRTTSSSSLPTTNPRLSRNNNNNAAPSSSLSKKQQQLRQYAEKYRRPDWVATASYEKFYGIAQEKQKQRAPAGIDQSISELTRNLPQATQNLLPSSVQQTASFGSLSFGGTATEVSDLEERRRQRQQRLQALQERHKMLQAGGSSAAVMMSSETHTTQQLGSGRGVVGFGGVQTNASSSLQLRPLPPANFGPSLSSEQQQQLPTVLSASGAGRQRMMAMMVMDQEQPRVVSSDPSPNKTAAVSRSQQAPQQPFRFLDSDDLRSTFTDEQLAILKKRAAALSPKREQQQQQEDAVGGVGGVSPPSPAQQLPTRGSAMRI